MESRVNRKKFVRYKEGAELYSISQSKFEKLAKDAKAIYVFLINFPGRKVFAKAIDKAAKYRYNCY